MKIAYLSNSTIVSRTANSIHVMKMCQALASHGHEIELLAPDRKGEYEPTGLDPFQYYGVAPVFAIRRIPLLPVIKGKAYLYGMLAALRARLRQADVVYARHIQGAFFAMLLGCRVILECHIPVAYRGRAAEWFFRRIICSKGFEQVVVITEALKKEYLRNYPSLEGKIFVAPDGADCESGAIRPMEYDESPGRLQVGYVGNLYRGKGMELIAEISRHCPWADFRVVGGLPEDLQRWQNECAGIRNLFFHGYVPHADTARFLKAFDVALLPNQAFVASHGTGRNNMSEWTSPLKLFEYMAAGKAIVASDLPVLREVLTDGGNALLRHPESVASWVEALQLLNADDGLRVRIGDQARLDFLRHYSWFARAGKIMGVCYGN